MKYSGRQATREGAVGKGAYNTSCKLVICASLFFYKETPGYEADTIATIGRHAASCKFSN
jgi:hypothetical protein